MMTKTFNFNSAEVRAEKYLVIKWMLFTELCRALILIDLYRTYLANTVWDLTKNQLLK